MQLRGSGWIIATALLGGLGSCASAPPPGARSATAPAPTAQVPATAAPTTADATTHAPAEPPPPPQVAAPAPAPPLQPAPPPADGELRLYREMLEPAEMEAIQRRANKLTARFPLSPDSAQLVAELLGADLIAIGPTGVAGHLSWMDEASRLLARRPDATIAVNALTEQSSPTVAKLYGLWILTGVDIAQARALARQLASSSAPVEMMIGCMGSMTTQDHVVHSIMAHPMNPQVESL